MGRIIKCTAVSQAESASGSVCLGNHNVNVVSGLVFQGIVVTSYIYCTVPQLLQRLVWDSNSMKYQSCISGVILVAVLCTRSVSLYVSPHEVTRSLLHIPASVLA